MRKKVVVGMSGGVDSSAAALRATSWSRTVYRWEASGKRTPNSGIFAPRRGDSENSLIWSVMSIRSPACQSVRTHPAALVTMRVSQPSSRSTRTA